MGIHGLVLSADVDWLKRKSTERKPARFVNMTLTYRQPKKPASPPVIAPPKRPGNKPAPNIKKEKKKKERMVLKPKPKKKSLKPKKIVKVPIQPKKVVYQEKPEAKTVSPSVSQTDGQARKNIEPIAAPSDQTISTEASKAPIRTEPVPDFKSLKEATPLYRRNPPPKYPRMARQRGYQGTVILEVLIDQNGKVSDQKVFTSSGHVMLDKAALSAVKEWLFEPGKRGNDMVEMWVKIPIRFQLE